MVGARTWRAVEQKVDGVQGRNDSSLDTSQLRPASRFQGSRDGRLKNIDNYFTYKWYSLDTARNAFEILRKSKLGGPGVLELRKIGSKYCVVTKNIIVGTSAKMKEFYGIPKVDSTDSWFPYEGNKKLELVTNSKIINYYHTVTIC
jgi:hypothetical protein